MTKITTDSYNEKIAHRGIRLIEPYVSAMKRGMLFECEKGHQWRTTCTIVTQGCGCPECLNDSKKHSLDIVKNRFEEKGFKLLGEYKNASTPTLVECSNGHHQERQPRYIFKGADCKVCSDERIRRRAERRAVAGLAKKNISMVGPYLGSEFKHTYECEFGHQWQTTLGNVIHKSGCPHCAGQRKDTQDLKDAVKERGITVLDEYEGAHKNIRFRCAAGHVWKARPANILNGRGCPSCAPVGFDSTKPGIFYIIKLLDEVTNKIYLKVGITNNSISERFKALPKTTNIIDVLREDWFQIGRRAADIEIEVKRSLKDFLTKDSGFMGWSGGETECYDLEELPT